MKQSTTYIFSIIQLLYGQSYLNVAVNLLYSRSDLTMTYSFFVNKVIPTQLPIKEVWPVQS